MKKQIERILSVNFKNFKCFDNEKFYQVKFNSKNNLVILSGPNGFGKTTIFDALELLFRGEITRYFTDIEHGSANLPNILLNNESSPGYIIFEFLDTDSNIITFTIKIPKGRIKLKDYNKFELYYSPQKTDQLFSDNNLYLGEKINSIDEIIEYSKEKYNIYYYLSQNESTHFLKQKVKERKNSLEALINVENYRKYIEAIDKLTFKKSASSPLIKKLNEIEKDIQDKLRIIKDSKKTTSSDSSQEYSFNKIFEENNNILWDNKTINWTANNTPDVLSKIINEINSIEYLCKNISDYKAYQFNESLQKYTIEIINDYVKIESYLTTENYKAAMLESIETKKSKLQIYRSSQFLFNQTELSKYSRESLLYLSSFFNIDINISKIEDHIEFLKSRIASLNETSQELKRINDMREDLKKHINKINKITNDTTCPFCNSTFADKESLLNNINNLTEIINRVIYTENELISDKKVNLAEILSVLNNKTMDFLGENFSSAPISEEIRYLENLLNDSNKLDTLISLHNLIKDEYNNNNDDESHLIKQNYIEKIIHSKKQKYNCQDFDSQYKLLDLKSLYAKYIPKENESVTISKFNNTTLIENKINYIKKSYHDFIKSQSDITFNQLTSLYTEKKKIEKVMAMLKNLKDIIAGEISHYENTLINNIKIPLLVYSSKIIQDYQYGLGVFINNNSDMRFTGNGNSKNDILNTFSSGQLSAFVLSYMMVMNKVYTESKKDLNFLLIDDPVQTMDDINISSFVEILRNEFSDKQVILSTHENDKENFILYKFLKYGIHGLSFNVKEKLYNL